LPRRPERLRHRDNPHRRQRIGWGGRPGSGDFCGGWNITAIGSSQGRIEITPQMSSEPSVSVNHIELPEGRFTTKLATTRFTYTFTPRMFFSGLLQYNSSRHVLSTNLRLRWEYQPGSELFVVYNDQRDTELGRSFPMLVNRAFIVTFTRLFRCASTTRFSKTRWWGICCRHIKAPASRTDVVICLVLRASAVRLEGPPESITMSLGPGTIIGPHRTTSPKRQTESPWDPARETSWKSTACRQAGHYERQRLSILVEERPNGPVMQLRL